MKSLPIADTQRPARPGRLRTLALHTVRILLFVTIIAVIHQQHRWTVAQQRGGQIEPLQVHQVMPLFPKASSLGPWDPKHGGQSVLDDEGNSLGFVVQTLPEADDVIGFSGPINTMLGFGADNRIVGMTIIRSGDTREHTRDVIRNEQFMTALNGLTWQAASSPQVDAVSGATLTSMSIIEGVSRRLGGTNPSSRFPSELTIDDAKPFFDQAARLEADEQKPSLRRVMDVDGQLLGKLTRTSPHADSMIGYQGPTDTLLAVDDQSRVIGGAIRSSFDNEPYVGYVKEDEYFFNIFKGFTLDDLADLDVVEAGIEGVSGATKTSTNVAEALIHTAKELKREQPTEQVLSKPWMKLTMRDYGTGLVVLIGVLIAMTHLRGKRSIRVGFQIVLVVYLGFINADMVSQALLVGWAQNGIPWPMAPGLVLLTVAALVCPVFTGRQAYCTHLCPFGSLQDWARRVPLRVKPSRRIDKTLRMIPGILLVVVVLTAMLHLPLSLVGIEPFDAFVFRIAGWATISVAIAGLLASLFVPMAYCHYGCPTGAMLGFLRMHSASGRLTWRDLFAAGLVVLAIGIYLA